MMQNMPATSPMPRMPQFPQGQPPQPGQNFGSGGQFPGQGPMQPPGQQGPQQAPTGGSPLQPPQYGAGLDPEDRRRMEEMERILMDLVAANRLGTVPLSSTPEQPPERRGEVGPAKGFARFRSAGPDPRSKKPGKAKPSKYAPSRERAQKAADQARAKKRGKTPVKSTKKGEVPKVARDGEYA